MTQLASQIVGAILNPVVLTFWLILISLIAFLMGFRNVHRLMLKLAVLFLGLVLFTPLANLIILPLEERFPRPELPSKVDGIISLGGGLEPVIAFGRNTAEQANAADRLYETALLAKRFPKAKVVHTGATWKAGKTQVPSGDIAKQYLVGLGIEPDRIVLQTKSRNTRDDVVLSKRMLNPKQDETWVVVTSAYHMPRAIGLFRKQKWPVIAWPSDYQTHGPAAATDFGYSPGSNLETMNLALHEWMGLLSYRLLGRTSELFPAPNDVDTPSN